MNCNRVYGVKRPIDKEGEAAWAELAGRRYLPLHEDPIVIFVLIILGLLLLYVLRNKFFLQYPQQPPQGSTVNLRQ